MKSFIAIASLLVGGVALGMVGYMSANPRAFTTKRTVTNVTLEVVPLQTKGRAESEAPEAEVSVELAPMVIHGGAVRRPAKPKQRVCEDSIVGYTDAEFRHPRLVRTCEWK